jgi:hypothetical protein
MAFLIKKQSFKKLTVILRVTGKLLLKSKDINMNLNQLLWMNSFLCMVHLKYTKYTLFMF